MDVDDRPEQRPQPPPLERGPARPESAFIEPELLHIPAGYFWMGSDDRDREAYDDEKPRHRILLPEIWIGRHPLTCEEYQLFLLANPGNDPPFGWAGRMASPGRGQHPVQDVSWLDALAYCRWLSGISGRLYTLPSEAEWEKAARGPEGLTYSWGHDWRADYCNTRESGINDTTPVGAFSPQGDSPYGCADMVGNVREWTRTLWGRHLKPEFNYPYGPQDGREDLEAPDYVYRVVRGGSWNLERRSGRCAYRGGRVPADLVNDVGFRLISLAPSPDPRPSG